MKKKKLNQLQLKKATISHLSKDTVGEQQFTRPTDQGILPVGGVEHSFECLSRLQLQCPSVICLPTFRIDCPTPSETCITVGCSPTTLPF